MLEVLATVFYIVACVAMFAFAIVIHELGHFVAARRLGLRVDAFSIGFGKILWKKTRNGVEYRICALPFGGYVSIPDVDPDGERKERIAPWKEIVVAFAGPFMNLVLAVFLAVLLACVPSARFGTVALDVARTIEGGPAEAAGILSGDRIVEINGNAVSSKSDMQTEFLLAKGRPSLLTILRGGTNVVVEVEPKFEKVGPVLEVPMLWVELKGPGGPAPAAWMPHRNPLRQLAWDAGGIFRVLRGLVTPKEAAATAAAIGGPVMIAEGLYRQVRRDKWEGLGFLRFLNVNLAILNLLPIPVLDGGLILFSLLAIVFRRRVPDAAVRAVSSFFMVALAGLMLLLVARDGWRSWKMHTYKPEAEGASENALPVADEKR